MEQGVDNISQEIKKHIPNFVFVEEKIKKDPDQRNYIVSNKKIESKGFKPQYSVDDGIRELIQGFKSYKFRKYSTCNQIKSTTNYWNTTKNFW